MSRKNAVNEVGDMLICNDTQYNNATCHVELDDGVRDPEHIDRNKVDVIGGAIGQENVRV